MEVVGVADLPVESDHEASARGISAAPFDIFFAREYRGVVGLASVLCGRRARGEELAQDAFLAAFRRWDQIGDYDDPGTWVRRVAANMATSAWRRRAREARALARLWRRAEPGAELTDGDGDFWAAVRALPPRQAQCVALRYLEDRSIQDIAGLLGISEATVRVHLSAGRRVLARRLAETLEEDIE